MTYFTANPRTVTSFPDCCGAAILSHFGGSKTLHVGIDMEKDVLIKWLDKQIEFQRKRMGMALLTCILDDTQMDEFGHIFKERGWVFADPAYHPKHSTKIYLGHISLFKEPPTEKKGEYGKHDSSFRMYSDHYEYVQE